jgi:hypothetical protein
MPRKNSINRSRGFKFFLLALYSVTLMIFISYVYDGLNFYLTPLIERPYHSDYRNLKPGGLRGHGLGIIGTLMMIYLLFYSLRKRTRLFGKAGSLSGWLDIHIYFGIMGPLFVILHTSFKINGIVAISFWSMIAVALSGVVGRYLYLQIPRGMRGNELDLAELDKRDQQLTQHILTTYSIEEKALSEIQQAIVGNLDPTRSMLRIFFSMLWADLSRFAKNHHIRLTLLKITRIHSSHLKRFIQIARRKAILHRRVTLWYKIQELFHYWHVIHKPFALIMYIVLIIHVTVTILFGYRWIF